MTPHHLNSVVPQVFAHRGASFDHPEMSREAYLAAIEQGADGFECDLRSTQDNVVICWHDPTLKRVADCDLAVATSTYAELVSAYPIITLQELLELAIGHKKNLALETKHPVPSRGKVERETLAILKNYQDQIRSSGISISIMSFSWLAIMRVRKSPWNTVFLAPHPWFFWFNPGKSIGPSVASLEKVRLTRRPRSARRTKIFVWTANTPEQILLCRKLEVDVMMTDRPAFAKAILENA